MACSHDHDCSDHECGALWTLYQHVDLPKVRCLNEAVAGSAEKRLFRPWDRRLDFSAGPCESADDAELLITVPFTGDVKLRAISIIGGPDGTSPSRLRIFVNREDLDFGNVSDLPPTQEFALVENTRGELEYTTKASKFQSVSNVTLHFPATFGADRMQLYYLAFKGEFTALRRDPIGTIVYESQAQPGDHCKITDTAQNHNFVGH